MFVDFEQMPAHAKVWVYQANRTLDKKTQKVILDNLKNFIEDWDAHGKTLKGSAILLYNLFLILAVDEEHNLASGCSIDKSVHYLKDLGTHLDIDFFDRSKQAFVQNGGIVLENFRNLKTHISAGMIEKETLTFNNAVTTVGEMKSDWQVPAGESWLAKYFQN
ncbi:hypothetical protein GXP67_16280 [Rhodocytophaga rosea]|uniref:ABC transporter ATPase n=1 Tax=Rhodocytophaga rosea TaxID=2704465 RepID=A0A6C0GJC8_9BACT|nr:hypothetical protein [Rhodocytophaga rosea]QHT68085.1 hypothetical protein GXP67_16280 [Rhodocytophaga rosea]